jgi:membrane-associated protein
MGSMDYPRFLGASVAATLLWVGLILPAGWYFGNIDIVKKNFELVVLGIIFVSLLPMVIELWKARRARPKA